MVGKTEKTLSLFLSLSRCTSFLRKISVIADLPPTFLTAGNSLLIFSEAMLTRKFLVLAGLRLPAMKVQMLSRVKSSFLARQDLSHARRAYSAVDSARRCRVDFSTDGLASWHYDIIGIMTSLLQIFSRSSLN